jgi:thioredoxin-related protein
LIKAGVFDAVMFRELRLDGAALVIGFDGTELPPQTLAVRYQAEITPTILFLDAQGKELIPRISGYTKNDYYSFYLERAIGKASRLVVKQAL